MARPPSCGAPAYEYGRGTRAALSDKLDNGRLNNSSRRKDKSPQ